MGRKFVSVCLGDDKPGDGLCLDDAGNVWIMESGNEKAGLEEALVGKNVAMIAVGGGEQYIALSEKDHVTPIEEASTADSIVAQLQEQIEIIKKEKSTSSTLSSNANELLTNLKNLLRHPSLLNSLFYDPANLNNLYHSLLTLPFQDELFKAIKSSIQSALDALYNSRMIYPESLHCFLHYLRFFDLTHSPPSLDPTGTTMQSLCESILSLPFEGYKNLQSLLRHYPPTLFQSMIVTPLLTQLDRSLHVDVDDDGVQHFTPTRKAAPVIATLLRWVYATAERHDLAPPQAFYVPSLSAESGIPIEVLYQDLRDATKTSAQGRLEFHITNFPFLIPPEQKRDLLQMENHVSMVQTAAERGMVVMPDSEGHAVLSFDPFFVLEVERGEEMLQMTFDAIAKASQKQLRKKLRIKFKNEEGVDAGGVIKEFFQLVSEELFSYGSGLWTSKYGDNVTWFNENTIILEDEKGEEGYERVGVIFGLALYNGVLLDVHFPLALYRKLLDLPLGLEDLIDDDIKKSLKQLLEYEGDDVEDIFCLFFEVSWMNLGCVETIPLKPNGGEIPVTSQNKEEYVILYVKWMLVDSIQPQWDAFQKGVDKIMDGASLNLFNPHELELLVVGTPDLDFDALRKNTEYEGGYTPETPVVKNLWKFISQADRTIQTQFLKFSTGSGRAPIGGLGKMDFKIQKHGLESMLPMSHTCFNTLLLPDYGEDYTILEERLGRAVGECEGFGLE